VNTASTLKNAGFASMCPENDDGPDKGLPAGEPSDGDDELEAGETPAEEDVETTLPSSDSAPQPPEYDIESTLPRTGPPADQQPPISTLPPTGYEPAAGQGPPPEEPVSTLPPTDYEPPPGEPISTLPPTGYKSPPPAQTPPPPRQQTPPTTRSYAQPGQPAAPQGTNAFAIGTVFANRFEIISQLGEGGMGQVFRVRDQQIEGREAALKVLHPKFSDNPQFRDLFFAEISANAGFVSEQVIQVRDTGHEEGRLFLTMDLVDGEDVRTLIDREQNLEARHALEITRQTLLGLATGHEKGFVHRDIKPSNIMLAKGIAKSDDNPHGVGVRLLDFGIAALADEMEDGQIAGTPMYMSPEQASGQRLDARSDLFSLGNVLFEMMSGSRLFSGTTVADITTSVLNVQVGPRIEELDHLSPAIRKILDKALQKDRKKRFQSAEEFIAAIEKSSAYRVPKGVPMWMGGLLAVSLVAAVGEGYLLMQKTQELADAKTQAGLTEVDSVARNVHEAALSSRDDRITLLEDEKGDQLKEINELRATAAADVSDTGDIDTMRSAREAAITAQETAAAALANLKSTYDTLTLQYNDLQSDKGSLTTKLNAALAELAAREYADNSNVNKARYFDKILEFIESNDGSRASVQLNNARNESLLLPGQGNGGKFLESLVGAAKSLQESVEEETPAAKAKWLEEAREDYGVAVADKGSLPTAAADWLTLSTTKDGEAPDRVAALDRVLTSLGEQIEAASDLTVQETEKEREVILEFDWKTSPDDVMAAVDSYGDDKAEPYFDSYVARAISKVTKGGRLLENELMRLEHLDKWGPWLAERTETLTTSACNTVRLLAGAKRFYSGETADFSAPIEPRDSLTAEPSYNWQHRLKLQAAMAKLKSAEIPGVGDKHYYRTKAGDRDPTWTLETLKPGGSGDLQIERQNWASASSKMVTVPAADVSFEGTAFYKKGKLILECTDLGKSVQVALWTPREGELPPAAANFQSLDIENFRRERERQPVPCLVIETVKAKLWYSPDFGLVRDARPGDSYLRELVEVASN